ncbi:phage tail protein [Georgenia sp. MJ170]|uniref:phage tail protein n=1 Tax=Georgenia sunbinii TaxID=3117728 RepID=UPI002F25F0AC
MTTLAEVDTAISVQYVVKIDDQSLGSFSSCEGLGCEVVIETREEGGNNAFVWQLPTRIKYSNIKLTRPLGADTSKIASWIAGVARGYTRSTATIQAKSSNGAIVAQWQLTGVVPVRWTGPSLSGDQAKVLTETIEIAHHGFLDTGGR